MQKGSIRLRLAPSEVKKFEETGQIEETVRLGANPHACLTYGLEESSAADELSLRYRENALTIIVPKAMAREWTRTELVSLAGRHDWGGDGIDLLVEKDFHRLASSSSAPETDCYPHPRAKTIS